MKKRRPRSPICNNSLTRFDELIKSCKKPVKPVYELKITYDEMQRVVQWAIKSPRKPAIVAFTAGAARDCARVFEMYFKIIEL